ncbi:hypothetical protein HUJ04_003937 [Dendroctonus ponderosae]|nr:hypothetical protein HUJ04_003937 [Dendroctonus ponderosae]
MAPKKKKSQLWTHFSKSSEGKVKCLYCGQQLSINKNKSTSSLVRHIKHKHPTQPIRRQIVTEAPIKEDNCSSSHHLLHAAEDSAQYPLSSGGGKLQVITSYSQEPLSIGKQKEIDKQLMFMIAKEFHPFSIVEDKEFKRLLYLLNPNYKVPTRKIVSNLMIPALYNEALELVKSRLDRAFAVCLTTEGWTSRTNDCFYSVTAHYIVEESNNTFLSSDLLGCISYTKNHTAENIADKLREVIEEWKLTNKIVAVVSDNEANMKAAVRIGGWNHWGCFAHSLNSVAQSGLSEIKEVVEKIKNIVGYFKSSSQALSQLQASAVGMDMPEIKLKNEVATRWNSTYDMIYRVLQMKNAIIFTLSVLKTLSLSKQHDDLELITQLHDDEWIVAEQAIKVLEIFNLVTLAISSEQKLNASSIIFYYKQISKDLNYTDLNEVMPQVRNMVEKLKFELQNRFSDIQENNLIAQATILDPRFKKLGFIDEEGYKRAVENLYTEVANTTLADENVENKRCDSFIKSEPIDQNIALEKIFIDVLWNDFDAEVRQHLKPSNSTISAIEEVNKYLEESILLRKDSSGALYELELAGCNEITEQGLWQCLHPRIVSLTLTDCINVADEAVGAVAQLLPALYEFQLQAYHVTDQALGYFSPKQGSSLGVLRLHSCWEITNHGVVNIVHSLPNLTVLSLSGCSKLTDDGVELIAENLQKLRSLDLSWCPRITDAALEYIACDLNQLEELTLDRCVHVTDIGIGYISTMLSLQSLYLRWCSQIRDFGLQHLCGMRNLQILSLAGCPLLTSNGLSSLIQLRHMCELELTNCPGASRELFDYLKEHLPRCLVIE